MPGLMRRTMVYLGLVDDEYDDFEPYDEPQPAAPPRQQTGRAAYPPEPEPSMSSIRTIPREQPDFATGGVTVQPRSAVVRPIQTVQNAKPHVVHPSSFADAQEIGDRLKASQPVIVNLTDADRELSRRMVDFCSGATYVLGGSMDKVAANVFLLTPSNVEVSAEEKRRLQERGYRT